MKQGIVELQPVGNAIFSLHTHGSSGVESKLKRVHGIAEVYVNYVADIVEVKFDPSKIKSEDIRAFMKKLE